MSRPILVATDLSPRCDRAVDRAAMLGRQLGAPVIALHVSADEDADDERWLERQRQELIAQCGDAGMELLVERGRDVPATIAHVAEARGCAVILTGVARFNHARDYLLGTAIDALVRATSVPVLVIKQRPREPYRRIVAATDFSGNAARALEVSAALLPDAGIRAVHASHSAYETWLDKDATLEFITERAEQEMRAFLDALPDPVRRRTEPRVEIGEIESALMLGMKEVDGDLLALGTHGRSALAHAALGSRASDILKSLPYDALIVKGS